MATRDVAAEPQRTLDYNYERYQSRHLVEEVQRALTGAGVHPGREAPDFELESTEGERVRLSSLRGRPVVLRFVSIT